MSELIRLAHGFSVRAMKTEERSVDVVASTAALDSYGEVLVQDWDLQRYLQNPIVLYGHNSWGFPIGHASDVRVEEGKLLATLNFVDAKANPMAEQVWQGILQGSLRAVSVGFRSKSASMQRIGDKDVYVLAGNELLEISVVPIPANPEAVIAAKKSMDLIRELAGVSDAPKPPKETKIMLLKTLIAVLAIASTASEDEVAAEVTRVKNAERDLLDVTGKESAAEAVGVVRGWKQAADQVARLREQNAELSSSIEKRDRDALIKSARAKGQLSPAQIPWAESCPLDALRGFVETAPSHPALKGVTVEEPEKRSALTFRGKTWSELSPGEKHDLHGENYDLYKAMRDEAKRAA